MGRLSRRQLLTLLGTGSVTGVAGCDQQQTGQTPTTSPTDTPTDSPTKTPADTTPPELLTYEAVPHSDAQQLAVRLKARDDRQITSARIWYGDSVLERHPDARQVSVTGVLENVLEQDPEELGTVRFLVKDEAGNVVEETYRPDETYPDITGYRVRPTTNAGEVVVTFEGEEREFDGPGTTSLYTAAVQMDDHTLEWDVKGQEAFSISGRTLNAAEQSDGLTPFATNTVTARLQDWAGNTAEEREQAYVRKYDKMEDTRLDIGAIYLSQTGGGFKRECVGEEGETEPAVGIYGEDPIPSEVSTKHIDQMTGHGINRMVYDYAGKGIDADRVHALLESELIDQIEIEPFYTKISLIRNMDKSWKETILPRDLRFVREKFMKRENAATYNDQPVVSTWNLTYLWGEDEAREKLMDEFGSFENFVDEMRSHLRVDRTDPFLILGKGPAEISDGEFLAELARQFDGITTWFPAGEWREGKTADWDAIISDVKRYFGNNKRFAERNGLEFTPRVFPGMNFVENRCREIDKRIPRSQDRFKQLFGLADKYRTSNRIDIISHNGWPDGHPIEPGTFAGTDYGKDYLQIVKTFQNA